MSHSLATAGLDKLLIRSPRWAGMALADLLPLDNSVRGHRSHRSVTYWVTAVTAGQRHPSAAGPGPATSRLTVTYSCSSPVRPAVDALGGASAARKVDEVCSASALKSYGSRSWSIVGPLDRRSEGDSGVDQRRHPNHSPYRQQNRAQAHRHPDEDAPTLRHLTRPEVHRSRLARVVINWHSECRLSYLPFRPLTRTRPKRLVPAKARIVVTDANPERNALRHSLDE